ncbi:hypothetical protein ETD86_30060 [Nonomuraea turkmeniaca]|uniref:Uncharacterized protein n=1 Tax=Nonomuraea turkmeniaca TaxID=103838 RepID=A0A5S4FAV9_9ACTN|nr:hypothetical protein [Nonomuraea turkmeniaca]TMR13811.1 hypothetical protein ETD86_30060 [Nonomuraea turkmeniaca]
MTRSGELLPVAVGELTDAHLGFEVRVTDGDGWLGYRDVILIGIRSWTHEGTPMVGLTDANVGDRPFQGCERIYPASTPCTLLRRLTPSRRRRTR